MSRVGHAEEAEVLARAYERGADELAAQMRALERELDQCRWRGVAAVGTKLAMQARVHQCHSTSQEMRNLATELRRYAHAVRDREQQLKRLERRVRTWAAANPPDPQRWPNASIIRFYPPSLDPAWEQIAQRLRTHGAVF